MPFVGNNCSRSSEAEFEEGEGLVGFGDDRRENECPGEVYRISVLTKGHLRSVITE